MITEEELANLESIEAAIRSREEDCDSILKYIQYADGGAYSQDLDYMRKLREEISVLREESESIKEGSYA